MGDVADMMLDGTLCEGCGVYLEHSLGEFPQRCGSCQRDDAQIAAGVVQPVQTHKTCKQCGKRVKWDGINDHIKAKHPTPSRT
jgi:hypothetical protein